MEVVEIWMRNFPACHGIKRMIDFYKAYPSFSMCVFDIVIDHHVYFIAMFLGVEAVWKQWMKMVLL